MNQIKNYAFLDKYVDDQLSYAFCSDFYKALIVLNGLAAKKTQRKVLFSPHGNHEEYDFHTSDV